MTSLENFMLFVPNRYHVEGRELHVSFNIAVIPSDMNVTSMRLSVPLPALSSPTTISCQEIAQGWDEQSILSAKPAKRPVRETVSVVPGMEEVHFELPDLIVPWRFRSLDNHGVHLAIQDAVSPPFQLENPPYLVVAIG
jgi:hypothetical protein